MSIFENWNEEFGNPQISVDETGATLTLRYWSLTANLFLDLPEIGSYYPGDLIQYSDTKLTNYTIIPQAGGERWSITLIYKSPQKGSGASYPSQRKDTSTQTYMSNGSLEKGIESVKLGAMDFLEKPADFNKLMEKIEQAKEKKTMLVEKRAEKKVKDILHRKGW